MGLNCSTEQTLGRTFSVVRTDKQWPQQGGYKFSVSGCYFSKIRCTSVSWKCSVCLPSSVRKNRVCSCFAVISHPIFLSFFLPSNKGEAGTEKFAVWLAGWAPSLRNLLFWPLVNRGALHTWAWERKTPKGSPAAWWDSPFLPLEI